MSIISSFNTPYTLQASSTRPQSRMIQPSSHSVAVFGAKSSTTDSSPADQIKTTRLDRRGYQNNRNEAYQKAQDILKKDGQWQGVLNRYKSYGRGKNWKFAWNKLKEGFNASKGWRKATYVLGPLAEVTFADLGLFGITFGGWAVVRAGFPGKATCWSNASRDFITAMQISEATHLDNDFANDDTIPYLTSHIKKEDNK